MVNWDEAGKKWPQPHPHAARLLRGLLWGQQYRHSNPQCEGGMPGSFELREDMGEDRLRAVEEWLRAEGYEYRFRHKRWRTWTRPDRPGEGLRPDGIEEDEMPNEYPSGASINVSMWDMIEKKFPALGNERRLQGSSSASPGKEKRSAGDRRRDRKWREYQEYLAAEAAQGAKGGTPAHSPQRAKDLKDIKPPMYDGNPLNLDRFLEKLDDWRMTVTEDMHPADAEKYVFRRFRYRLPEVLGELYFVATKEGRIKTLKEAKKWLNEQERVDAPQVAAKRWKSIKLQHDGREVRLPDWRDFRGHYTLLRRNVEDWNEGDEQARLLSMLPEAWIKRVTKEESKRAKSNHTVKMMLLKEYHTNVVAWTRKNVARDVKRHSLRNALLITVSGDREKTAMWRLDECELSGQTIRLQAIPARMSCDEILEWVGEEVLKEYRNLHHTRGLRPGDRDVNHVGEGPGGEAAMDPAGADGDETLVDNDDDDEPAEVAVCAFVAKNLSARSKPGNWKPLQQGWRKQEKRDPRRIGDPPLSFGEFIRAHPQGCFVCYGRKRGFNHDHRTCHVHKADTEAYKKAPGRRSVRPRVSGKPKWRSTRTSWPS